jgi:DNA-binding transcriptional MerR regulator
MGAEQIETANLMTIEELAAATGMTVRNIRSHRTAGLLPAPIVRERTGYYDQEHLERLRTIQKLQSEGFNLRGIQRLLDQTSGGAEAVSALRQMVSEGFSAESPRVYTLQELIELFGPTAADEPLARAVRMGLLVPLPDGRVEAPAPALIEIAAEVVARGVPLSHAIAVVGKMRERCQSIGREFVRMFLDDVWKPFVDAGYPEDRWLEVLETIQRLRPLSAQALLSVYGLTMSEQVESAFGREIEKFSKRP